MLSRQKDYIRIYTWLAKSNYVIIIVAILLTNRSVWVWVSKCVHVRDVTDVTERKNSRMQNTKRTTTPKDALTYTEQCQSSTVGNHQWPQHETEEKYTRTKHTQEQ